MYCICNNTWHRHRDDFIFKRVHRVIGNLGKDGRRYHDLNMQLIMDVSGEVLILAVKSAQGGIRGLQRETTCLALEKLPKMWCRTETSQLGLIVSRQKEAGCPAVRRDVESPFPVPTVGKGWVGTDTVWIKCGACSAAHCTCTGLEWQGFYLSFQKVFSESSSDIMLLYLMWAKNKFWKSLKSRTLRSVVNMMGYCQAFSHVAFTASEDPWPPSEK